MSRPTRILLAVLLAVLTGCRSEAGEPFELTILHTNDVHARFLAFTRAGSTCAAEEPSAGPCYGGAARRATLIRKIREERKHVLLLDAGDQFQGSLFFSRYKGEATQQVMNHLGYDAMVVGNHEFDDGPELLGQFARGCNFPILATNVDASREPSLDGQLLPYSLSALGGETVGLVGYITEEAGVLSRPGPTVEFLSIEETLGQTIAALGAQGVNKIVALSHAGLRRDREVASRVAGIDVIVGGHTNTLLSNGEEGAEGPYPIVATGPSGDPVLIVQAFAWGMYLGHLDVIFDRRGVLSHWSGDVVPLDDSIAPDPKTAELIDAMAETLRTFSGQVIGSTEVALQGSERNCRFAECNLGNLIADALREATAHQGVEVALHNGGGIRASIPKGDITVGQIMEVLPFANTASTFSLRGDDLWRTLEHGLSRAEDPDNDGTGRFLQVSGLRYRWTAEAEVGERLLSVEVLSSAGSFGALDPQRLYKVVSNDFNRTGGDGYAVLADRAIDPYDQGRLLSDVVQDYLRRHSPVSPAIEGRIRRREETP